MGNFGLFLVESADYVTEYFNDIDIHAAYTYRSIAQQTIINECVSIDDYNDLLTLDSTERDEIESLYHFDERRVFIFICQDVIDSDSIKRAGLSGINSGGYVAVGFLADYYTKLGIEVAKQYCNLVDELSYDNIQRKYILHELGHCLHIGLFDNIYSDEIYSGSSEDVTPPNSRNVPIGTIFGVKRTLNIDEWPIMSKPTRKFPYNELIGAFSISEGEYESEELYSSW